MNRDIKNYLDYLVNEGFINKYEKEDDYITLFYPLSDIEEISRSIDYSDDMDIISFLNTIIISSCEVADDFYGCLVDENDFYGYNNEKELEYRIDEEAQYLKSLAYMYEKYDLKGEN